MRIRPVARLSMYALLVTATAAGAQTAQPTASVPRIINLSGVFRPADGQTAAPAETVRIAVYADEFGGSPLWEERQTVRIGGDGQYNILLGATLRDGVPVEVFASGEGRWLGMTWERPAETEGPRVRITSVPYALRASDADTLGGHPVSAFMLTSQADSSGTGATSPASVTSAQGMALPNVVLGGTPNFLAKYVNTSDVGNSAVYETGGTVGIGTTTPFDSLHVRFNNTNGAFTGYAVQNLGNTATSYSGMLFYDQNGALGQFQGFNNSTHEYRINNIASGGSINFMIGSSSKFKVANNGFIEVSPSDAAAQLMVGPIVGGSDFSGNLGVTGDGNGGQGVAMFDKTSGDGILVRFRQNGNTQGTIDVAAGVVSYNAFTGSHYARTDETIERGSLVSLTGKNGRLEDKPGSEILYGVTKSRQANDPAILGSYLARQNPTATGLGEFANPHLVEAVGNGEMWVIDTGRDLVAGDYLVSSDVAGHAMTDPGTFDVSYIVARLAEPINWKNITTTVAGPDGQEYKRALVSVFFENFIIDRTRGLATDAELARMRTEIASLTAQLTALEARDKAREARLAQLEKGRDSSSERTVTAVIDRR